MLWRQSRDWHTILVEAEVDVVLLEVLASTERLPPQLYERSRISRLPFSGASPTRLRVS
jgi:hypothetical protein